MFGEIILGIFHGVGIAGFGYAKHVKEGHFPKFEPKKFFQTVIVGGIVGGVAGSSGMSYAATETWLATSGGIILIEWAKTIVARLLGFGAKPEPEA